MTNLTNYRVTDGLDDILAAQYNRVLDSTLRGLFSNTETLGANKTLIDADFPTQHLTVNAARDVNLPAVSTNNHVFYIYNKTAATHSITVKDAGGATILVLPPLTGGMFVSDGVTWSAIGGLDTELRALAGLTSAADSFPYFTGSGTAALLVIVSAIRTLLASADLATFRSNAGLAIGTNVQAFNANLAALAGLTSAADKLPYFTGSGAAALADFVAGGRALAGLAGVANRVPYYTGTSAAALAPLWIPVQKTSDETITSDNTLNTDAALFFSMLANTKYTILARIFFTTGITPDFKYRFNGPASPTFVSGLVSHIVPGTTALVSLVESTIPTTTVAVTSAGGTIGGYVEAEIIVQNGANAGTFAFNWSQNTSDPVNTTVHAGSYLQYMIG